MNYVKNDKGEYVIAVGAPGSIERAKVEWPALIERINEIFNSSYQYFGQGIDEAVQLIRDTGITSGLETRSILHSSLYVYAPTSSASWLVLNLNV